MNKEVTPLPAGLGQLVEVDDNGCWLWTGRRGGAGNHYAYMGRNVRVHRIVYCLLVRPLDANEHLDHTCRVRHCVNPAHLEPVTLGANVERMWAARGITPGREKCSEGHALTDDNVYRSNRPDGVERRQCKQCKRDRRADRTSAAVTP